PSMKKGWAAGAPEFGKLIVPSTAFWAEAEDATSQHPTLSSTDATAARRRGATGFPQPLNCDLTLAMRTSFTTLPSPPTTHSGIVGVRNDDDITVTATRSARR